MNPLCEKYADHHLEAAFESGALAELAAHSAACPRCLRRVEAAIEVESALYEWADEVTARSAAPNWPENWEQAPDAQPLPGRESSGARFRGSSFQGSFAAAMALAAGLVMGVFITKSDRSPEDNGMAWVTDPAGLGIVQKGGARGAGIGIQRLNAQGEAMPLNLSRQQIGRGVVGAEDILHLNIPRPENIGADQPWQLVAMGLHPTGQTFPLQHPKAGGARLEMGPSTPQKNLGPLSLGALKLKAGDELRLFIYAGAYIPSGLIESIQKADKSDPHWPSLPPQRIGDAHHIILTIQ